MLKELSQPQQREGESRRRWFSGDHSDLTVWLADNDRPDGFQFSFRDNESEHALTWRPGSAIRFHTVDAGENDPRSNQTPLLVPNGRPHWPSLESHFARESESLDPAIRDYMLGSLEKLKYSGTSWAGQESDLAPFCRWTDALNQHDPDRYLPLFIGVEVYGYIPRSLRAGLISECDCLVNHDDGIALEYETGSFSALTEALDSVADHLHRSGHSRSRMDEPYPVTNRSRAESIGHVERTVVGQLGLRNFSQHINGFVRKPDGIHLWVGERAKDKPTWPGKLDQMVAGGLPATISLRDNLLKECYEEAGIPPELAARAEPVGTVSYRYDLNNGLRRDILYCYDLELPASFEPQCTDGEVDHFQLMPLEAVAERVATSEDFKANCNLIIIDFLLRHHHFDPEQSGYAELCAGLNSASA